MLKATDLRCEYQQNPLGLDALKPRFSWKLQSNKTNVLQTSYKVIVKKEDGTTVWDSGRLNSQRSIQVEYNGAPLAPRTKYIWSVEIANNKGETASADAAFETGLMGSWQASFLTHAIPAEELSEKCPMLRCDFTLSGEVKSARAYASSLGLYELYFNGAKAGNLFLAPGWTNYRQRLQYQTYDVTSLLKSGGNGVGILLGNGWYKGNIGFHGETNRYGDRHAAILELHVEYTNGSCEVITTDEKWLSGTGGILMSEIYHGETFDARLEPKGWSEYGFDASGWHETKQYGHAKDILTAQENAGTVMNERIAPVTLIHAPNGETLIDFGQNMTGFVEVSANLAAGAKITLRHGEVLDRDGNLYLANLRTARQTTEYIGDGTQHTFRPHFTFMGFRYIAVEGMGDNPPLSAFTGVVLHTDMDVTGSFECSHPLLNQLAKNIKWGQKGNFLDLPTDCPQRDERLGWTGDAQIFCRTACFNMDTALFFTKWLRDLRSEQREDGRIPNVAPDVLGTGGACGWGDATVIIPWTLYQCYGDTRILEEQYDSMKKWVLYIKSEGENPYLWNTGRHYGDWVSLDNGDGVHVGATPTDYLATAFYAYSTALTAKVAAILNKKEEEKELLELYDNIIAAFRQEYVTPNGRVAATTQTANVIALMFDLVKPEHRVRAVNALKKGIEMRDGHLDTGFLGTPYLCHVLSENGLHNLASALVLKEDYPSWLYPVKKGATTIWERWDGIKADGSFQRVKMNSFNHYAYGSIGDWLYRKAAGLDIGAPGYSRLHIQPYYCEGLTYAKAEHETMYGKAASGWVMDGDAVKLTITIPHNTEADIVLTGIAADSLKQSGLNVVGKEEGKVCLSAGSGTYTLEYQLSR